ncbi:MAG: DUF6069 family protein [Humibacillus sp.]|nr:DUF6069 family protein [Humibacillus sp.]MDN5778605.1 DUF6069 family protein [Humibacillus sp.]
MTTQPLPPGPRDPGDQFRSDPRIVVDAPRLWAGGVATAVVAGLVAWVGVLIADGILDFNIARAAVILSVFDSLTGNYVLTAVLLALAGTGLAHALCLTTPRPTAFFGWIVGLLTLVGVMIPFTRGGTMADKVSVGVINLVIGIVIGSLISAVMARTVVDRGTRVPPRR